MQRWSMGHSRLRHGLHSTGSRTMRASGPVGPVPYSSVAPKTATVGTPSADATCMAPESLVKYTRHAAAISMYSARVVSPAKFFTGAVQRGFDGGAQFALDPASRRSRPLRRGRAPRGWPPPRNVRAATAWRSHTPRRGSRRQYFPPCRVFESARAREARGRCAVEADEIVLGQSIENAGAVQQFQIVKTLMPRNFAGFRYRHGAREQSAAAIARITDAFRNPARRTRRLRLRRRFGAGSRSRNFRREGRGRRATSIRDWWACRESHDGRMARVHRDRRPRAWRGWRFRRAGNRSCRARRAGRDMTASPTQLVARTRIFR